MFRTLFPIAAILISLVILFSYVKPALNEVKLVQSEREEYLEVIEDVTTLNQLIEKLIAELDTVGTRNLSRLDKFLPNQIDEVRFLYDLDAIAQKNGMLFGNVAVASDNDITQADTTAVTSIDVSFALIGSYEQLKAILKDFEESLTPMEVIDIVFTAGLGDLMQFDLTLRTFGLSYNN